MNVVKDLSIGNPPEEVNVFVEIPRGSKNKYELDKDSGLIAHDRTLYTPFVYPADYGLVPQTHWHDGDPLDALIINTAEPYFPGVYVPCRVVGVIRMVDDGEKDEKLVCVPADNPQTDGIKDIRDVSEHLLAEIKYFFEHYKDLQKKEVKISSIDGRDDAIKVIDEAIELYKNKK